jgi:uncharacterized protein YecT (DUF1311 family)
MQRNMQNLSFLAIIGVLLSCAFFFSQQADANVQSPLSINSISSEIGNTQPESVEDIPNCAGLEQAEESMACYRDAAALSEQLLDSKVNAVLAKETDSQRRMDFIEIQHAWEESRDKDCAFIQGLSQDELNTALSEAICLTEHNISRFEQLQSYYCEWYNSAQCDAEN